MRHLLILILVTTLALEKAYASRFDNGMSEPDNIHEQIPDKYLEMYHSRADKFRTIKRSYSVKGSEKPRQFELSIETSTRLTDSITNSSSFSYLFFDNGKVIYDELPAEGRFKKEFTNETYFPSNSMGKSVTSYMIGHAICEGYIDSIDSPLDFPLMENTLYYEQPLIHLLNMASGDKHVIGRSGFVSTGRRYHGEFPILSAAKKELKGTKPLRPVGNNVHYYSNYTADILYSYMMYKVGAENWDKFVADFFQNHIRIEHPIYWEFNPTIATFNVTLKKKIAEGVGRYGLFATRYDYLRIANSIMDDWQNETCEGKYLKQLYERRISRNKNVYFSDYSWKKGSQPTIWTNSEEYAGQFYTTLNGLKDRTILGLDGAHGQQIIIDMDTSRIAVVASNQERYVSGRELLYEPIKFGRIQSNDPDTIEVKAEIEPLKGPKDGCSDPTFAEMMGKKCN